MRPLQQYKIATLSKRKCKKALLGATDTFVAAQGVGQEAAENVEKEIICEASRCVPLVWGLLHF
jgi:signal recognition particle GTPase